MKERERESKEAIKQVEPRRVKSSLRTCSFEPHAFRIDQQAGRRTMKAESKELLRNIGILSSWKEKSIILASRTAQVK